jgi:hypothetical protein
MFCPQCGFNNDQQSLHCSQCGAALQQLANFQAQPPQFPAPGTPPSNVPLQYNPGATLMPASVPNYMVQAVLVTLFCCLPLGIVGIIRSGEVNKRLAANDYAGALAASQSTRTILWWGFGTGLVVIILWTIVQLANVANTLH